MLVVQQLTNKIRAAMDAEFFGHYAQRGIRRNKVHGPNARIALDREQKLAQKY